MNRRDMIKSAVALALYGARLPAWARLLPERSDGSPPAPPQGTPFPRTAIVAINGSGSTEEATWTATSSGGSDTYQGVLVGLKLIM